MRSERIGVIGGTGFLGSHVVEALVQAGYSPVVVARKPDRIAEVLPGIDVETRQGDLSDRDSLRSALSGCHALHCVVSLMSPIFFSPDAQLREAAIRSNVEGTRNALRTAREVGAQCAVVTSTAGTRYQPGGALANEDSPPTQASVIHEPYIQSKVLIEAAVGRFAQETGLRVACILPGGMIGPRVAGASLFGRSLVDYLNGRVFFMIDGAFAIVDVRDVARAHVAAMERATSGRSYLVVNATIPLREYFSTLTRLTGLPGPRIYLPPRLMMPVAYLMEMSARLTRTVPQLTRSVLRHPVLRQQYDCTRVQQELGVTFTPLEATLRDAVTWLIDTGCVSQPG